MGCQQNGRIRPIYTQYIMEASESTRLEMQESKKAFNG